MIARMISQRINDPRVSAAIEYSPKFHRSAERDHPSSLRAKRSNLGPTLRAIWVASLRYPSKQLLEEITPLRVRSFDQFQLFRSRSTFDLLFARDGRGHVFERLEIDQPSDCVFGRKPGF